MTGPLDGWRVVVTGDVPGLDRGAAQDAVRMMGGTAVTSVTPTTDLLVVGTGAGASKLAKAAALRLRQLPAAEFAELAENPDRWDGRSLGTVVEDPGADEHPDAPPARSALRPERPAPRPGAAHVAGLTTYTRDGQWTAVATCRCGHRSAGGSTAEAEAAHRAHRLDVGDPEPPDGR